MMAFLLYSILSTLLGPPKPTDLNPTDLTPSERIDVLKHLSDVQRQQFDIRQKLEWRVIFTALTFYVLIPVGVNAKSIELPDDFYLTLIMYLFFTGVILRFLFRIQSAHVANKYAAEHAEDLLWRSVGEDASEIFYRDHRTRDRAYIWRRARVFLLLQVLMLVFFAWISLMAATKWSLRL